MNVGKFPKKVFSFINNLAINIKNKKLYLYCDFKKKCNLFINFFFLLKDTTMMIHF